jgi:hypothetical protein
MPAPVAGIGVFAGRLFRGLSTISAMFSSGPN